IQRATGHLTRRSLSPNLDPRPPFFLGGREALSRPAMDTAEAAWGVASLRLGSRRLGSRSSYRERGADVFSRASSAAGAGSEDDEEALMWAALERLPTHSRVRKGFVVGDDGSGVELGLIDVAALGYQERTRLLDRLVRVAEEDHEHFLRRLKQRIDR
uniref:ABC-transporter N-terminal domain-containing protein n=1 Tax=Aegilops tauschii subsp. strangulata TaxID=200361 RepID=A0A453SGL1_AEGTS